MRQNVDSGTSLKITDVKGEFHIGEQIKFDGVDENARSIVDVVNYELSDIKSVKVQVESPPLLLMSFRTLNSLLEFASVSSAGKVTVPGLTWPGISTSNNLVSYTDPFRDLPVINRVSNGQYQFNYPHLYRIFGVCDGSYSFR